MKKWLFRIVWIPVLLLAVLFLVANRTLVPISLDPFRPDNPAMSTPALPLWFWLMGMLFIGVALGAAGQWLSGRETRAQARDNRRELRAVKKELAALEARQQKAAPEEDPAEPPKLEATNI
ncbi:LapA family protein [Hyphococcus sp.]|uniref:LapA family protein n=1 Tax=Hyphococcus sp. TaxID=2038636 RepID=UPI0035C7196C